MDQTKREHSELKPVLAAVFSFLAVYLFPFFILWNASNTAVLAFGWILSVSPSGFFFNVLSISVMFQLLPFDGVFLLVPVQVWRFYRGRTTIRRVMLVGALGWAPYLFVIFRSILLSLWDPFYPHIEIYGVPLPVSLILVYLTSRLSPPLSDTTGQWLQESPSTHA